MNDTTPLANPAHIATLALPAAVTIDTIEALADQIHGLDLPTGAHLTLDATHTENLTTPGLQLFVALEKTLAQTGGQLRLTHLREEIAENFHLLGLAAQLNAWSNSNG